MAKIKEPKGDISAWLNKDLEARRLADLGPKKVRDFHSKWQPRVRHPDEVLPRTWKPEGTYYGELTGSTRPGAYDAMKVKSHGVRT